MEIFKKQIDLLVEESDIIAKLANISAFLNEYFNDINWVGFYLNKNQELILGPFQGKVACTKIPFNKGVCGFSATNKKSIIVDNVHDFKDHIACDTNSNSEIVVPIIVDDEIFGVIDVDSPKFNRFTEEDKKKLEYVASCISKSL
ncbi:MAG: GAF domain-containing protein [Erysipelotrichaceae bacterium]|nr:GAF domain-containing protein [Erysipelotrichaceae bacterium]